MTRLLSLLIALTGFAMAPAPAPAGEAALDAALKSAAARRAPVIIDFHAPWCYSCYYMAKNVLTGPEWEKVERASVVLELDADAPEGAAVMKQWNIKALPSYLVLDAGGRELGRILGEQTRAEFYGKLGEITGRGATLDELAVRVTDGSAASVRAARDVLRFFHARYDASGGLAWFAARPAAARAAIAKDAGSALWVERLHFLKASQDENAAACLAHGPQVLAGELGCERAYELDRYISSCAAAAPLARSLLAAQRPAADKLVADGVFGTSASACADERSVVLVAADLYKELGDSPAESAVLDRAIAQARARIGKDLSADRNLADNLRVYLDRAGKTAELDALLVQLIAAYPGDYVYAFRHGRNLVARGAFAEALPFLEQAAGQAYGVNRLKVAEQRVKALRGLKRDAEARKVVAEALKANGPWFAEDAAKLKALLAG